MIASDHAPAIRTMVCGALDRTPISFRKRTIDRTHLFYTVLNHAMTSKGAADRTYYAYEFALIEKLVKAAQAGNAPASRGWYGEVERARRAAEARVAVPDALDVLLYPARALIAYTEGDRAGTHRLLDRADRSLTAYLDQGGVDAGVAILEQKLNRFRCHAKFGGGRAVADFAVEFVLGALGHPLGPSWGRGRLTSNFGPEAVNIQACYIDSVLLACITQGDADAVAAVLRRLAERDRPDAAASPALGLARLCVAAIDADGGGRGPIPVLDGDPLRCAPSTLVALLDALTGDGASTREDALSRALSGYEDRDRIGAAVRGWRHRDVAEPLH